MTDSITVDRCTLDLTGAELAVIVKYLHEGPFKEVSAVVQKIEEQVMAQWRAKQQPPDTAYPKMPPRIVDVPDDEPVPQQ